MHIRDLAKAYLAFNSESTCRRVTGLFANRLRSQEQLNQPIHVRDLVVRPTGSETYGESWQDEVRADDRTRLVSHIVMLMKLVNADHQARNCRLVIREEDSSPHYELKPDKRNHITRLVTPEFSLYTKTPLTMVEFRQLSVVLENEALLLLPNTVMILGSLSVLSDDGELINMSLFIAGGDDGPTLTCFAKNTASSSDVKYTANQRLLSQSEEDESSQLGFMTGNAGRNIYSGGVFELSTAGGALFTQTVGVCLDHVAGHVKKALVTKLMSKQFVDQLIPEQIEQCVISNTTALEESNCIATTVLHVDPQLSMVKDYGAIQGQGMLSGEDIRNLEKTIGIDTRLHKIDSGYRIEQPPFAGTLVVDLLAERPLARFESDFQQQVVEHNDKALRRFAIQYGSHNDGEASTYLSSFLLNPDELKEKLVAALHRCQARLLEHTEPGFFESFFMTEQWLDKEEATIVLIDSFTQLLDDISHSTTAFLFLIKPWQSELNREISLLGIADKPSDLQRALSSTLDEFVEGELSNLLEISFSDDRDYDDTVEHTKR